MLKRYTLCLLSLVLFFCIYTPAQAQYHSGTYSGSAVGMGGNVIVTVVIADGVFTDIQIDTSSETPGIGDIAAEKMTKRILELQSAEADIVSGATITSTAIIKALELALLQAEQVNCTYIDGEYSAHAEGMGGSVAVCLTISSNAIIDIQIDASSETPGIGDLAAEKMKERILEAQNADVDTVTSATITSNAIVSAAKAALEQALQ